MKTLLKLIVIGIIAGATFRYLSSGRLNPEKTFRDVREWITEKAGEISRVAAESKQEEPEYSHGEKGSPEISEEILPSAEPVYDILPDSAPPSLSSLSPVNNFRTDIIEYPVEEKTFPGTERFPELDQHARNTPQHAEVSMESLADWLVKPAVSELEKARLLFTWTATHIRYDDRGYNTGNYSGTSAEEVFRNRVSVCQGYSELFTALCRLAGLEAETITGYAKGISYRSGARFSDTNHAWNAVKINGGWKLFDVTWAAGFGRGVNGRLVTEMKFNDYWFNVRPDEAIFTHLPKDELWQLNDNKITLAQFERLPNLSSEYFSLGFNGSEVFPAVLSGKLTSFPESYSADSRIKVVSIPYSGRLRQGMTMKVILRSGTAQKIAYRNGGNITDLTRNGDEYSAVIVTRPGSLSFMARYEEGRGSYDVILEYKIE